MNDYVATDEYPLIKECLNGNSDKYAILVDRYKTMVYTVAYRMLGDAEAANDMAQEGFISAYQGLKNFRSDSRFSSWLCAIVMNKCRDHLRARRESVSVDDLAEIRPDKKPSPEDLTFARQTGDLIQDALNMLPREYREVIVLKHIEELEYREMAHILGVSEGALKVRAHRGREMLKKLLEMAGVTNG